MIDDTAFTEKKEGVKGFKDLGSRLVDDSDDGDIEPGEFFQSHHD